MNYKVDPDLKKLHLYWHPYNQETSFTLQTSAEGNRSGEWVFTTKRICAQH